MHIRLPLLALLVASGFALTARAEIQTFKIDNTHSFANWEIRHVVARVSGTFHDVQGKGCWTRTTWPSPPWRPASASTVSTPPT